MTSFDSCWNVIISNEGETFHTKTNKPFTYVVKNNSLVPSRTEYNISKKDFEKIFKLGRLEGPGLISNDVRGSAYVWAIMHDERIRPS
jgi:hypothetical protein